MGKTGHQAVGICTGIALATILHRMGMPTMSVVLRPAINRALCPDLFETEQFGPSRSFLEGTRFQRSTGRAGPVRWGQNGGVSVGSFGMPLTGAP